MVTVEPHDGTGPLPVSTACLVAGPDRDQLGLDRGQVGQFW